MYDEIGDCRFQIKKYKDNEVLFKSKELKLKNEIDRLIYQNSTNESEIQSLRMQIKELKIN